VNAILEVIKYDAEDTITTVNEIIEQLGAEEADLRGWFRSPGLWYKYII
jgi:hypothetical protein